jgi:two-component system NtrC family sensor kinase
VLLNLINNAFQAVNEASITSAYEENKPVVILTTKQELKADGPKQITIKIKDNGSGIQDSIKDKILQPFFTTKDTGKGTELGLSLAYDIVRAHGGKLSVESEEGKGSEFIIDIPF